MIDRLPELVKGYSFFNEQIIKSMGEISKLAEKGPSNLLMSLGTVLIIAAMGLQYFSLTSLKTGEFICVIIAATVLLLIGSYLRFYQYKNQQEINKGLRKFGTDLLSKSLVEKEANL